MRRNAGLFLFVLLGLPILARAGVADLGGAFGATQAQLNSRASSGPVTTSNLTQSTSKMLGRTTAGTGAIEEISVGSGLSLSGGSLAATGGSSGVILQATSVIKTDTFVESSNDGAYHDVTGLAVTLTPSSASNKVFVMVTIGAISNGLNAQNLFGAFQVTRNGTAVGVGDAAGSRVQASAGASFSDRNYVNSAAFSFLDSPATTSAVTYQVQLYSDGSGLTPAVLNRSGGDSNNSQSNNARTASSITAWEVAQ